MPSWHLPSPRLLHRSKVAKLLLVMAQGPTPVRAQTAPQPLRQTATGLVLRALALKLVPEVRPLAPLRLASVLASLRCPSQLVAFWVILVAAVTSHLSPSRLVLRCPPAVPLLEALRATARTSSNPCLAL